MKIFQDEKYATEDFRRVFLKTTDGPFKADESLQMVSLCPISDLTKPSADVWQLTGWLAREKGSSEWKSTHSIQLGFKIIFENYYLGHIKYNIPLGPWKHVGSAVIGRNQFAWCNITN